MIDSIIFDFDGVIVDSVHIKTEAFIALYSTYPDHIKNKVKLHHLENTGISRYKKIYFYFRGFIPKKKLIENITINTRRIRLDISEKLT